MEKYEILVSPRAELDLDEIYDYIANKLTEKQAAIKLAGLLEEAILSLETFPNRGAQRRTGAYANKGYRQLFVKNFTIIYRVNEHEKKVIVLTLRYSKSDF